MEFFVPNFSPLLNMSCTYRYTFIRSFIFPFKCKQNSLNRHIFLITYTKKKAKQNHFSISSKKIEQTRHCEHVNRSLLIIEINNKNKHDLIKMKNNNICTANFIFCI